LIRVALILIASLSLFADFSYVAKIGKADHYNSDGLRIDKAEYIIQQDRANYHKFKKRDPQDESDPFFKTKENRAKMYRMIQRGGGLDRRVRRAILNGNPLIKVKVKGNRMYVSLLKDAPAKESRVSKKNSKKGDINKEVTDIFLELCKKGDRESCAIMGGLYMEGKGVRRSISKGLKYYKKSCRLGDSNSCRNLGIIYANGEEVKRNLALSLKYLKKSCKLGNKRACKEAKIVRREMR